MVLSNPAGVSTGAGNHVLSGFLFDAVTYLQENGLLIVKDPTGSDSQKAREINEFFSGMIKQIISSIARDITTFYLVPGKPRMLRLTDRHILSVLPIQSGIQSATRRRIERIPKQLEIAKLEKLRNSRFFMATNGYNIDNYLYYFSEGFAFYDRMLKSE
ncbi:Hypothetical protein GLP15_3367 [Giardia lamblia P15]|uniref:Uncharacterized protein n=1 Tax=Giardia intestinalis (strain P15) TaxID=658858 RepID=E1EVW4_GIAIA|nr:Hypothetical protein GLP15_3367 [Giardia lamblia P15]